MLGAQEHYVLPAAVPTAAVVLMATAAVGAWVALHVLAFRLASRAAGGSPPPSRLTATFRSLLEGAPLVALAGVLVGFVAMLACAQAIQRGLVLATNWPIWPIALAGAVAVEIVLLLYALERRTVSRRAGLALGALRVALVVLVIIVLAQPVRPWESSRSQERFVAVLVDGSASMQVPDAQMPRADRVRLAETLAVRGVRRPYDLAGAAGAMEEAAARLAALDDWFGPLGALDPGPRAAQIDARKDEVARSLRGAADLLDRQVGRIEAPLRGNLRIGEAGAADLAEVKRGLQEEVKGPLEGLARTFEKHPARDLAASHGRVLADLRAAGAALARLAPRTRSLADALDNAYYDSLPKDVQAKVDEAARKTRLALARDVLLAERTADAQGRRAGEPLLESLQDKYTVNVYTFARESAELDLEKWEASGELAGKEQQGSGVRGPGSGDRPTGIAGPPAPNGGDGAAAPIRNPQSEIRNPEGATDLAAALQKVMTDMAGRDMAGVLLLTDGRHNAAAPVEPIARQLGAQGVCVSSIVFGSAKPPCDASIVAVDAPETVFTEDKVYVNATLKLDGLAGREVTATLHDGQEVVDSRTVRVPTDSYRARVQLGHEPKAPGIHRYRVEVQPFEGEVFEANNQYPLAVNVTDDRVKVLLVDGRPRWEFRYLKNLFADRDQSVRLQYVLCRPDRIEGVPGRKKVPASVTRDLRESEATDLPENEAEWLKFNVIVLGDVPPAVLQEDDWKALRTFVADRGGTLIVIAGPLYMPHAYSEPALRDLLPVRFEETEKALMTGPEKFFRVALTAEGRESVLLRQRTDPQENLEVWNSFPDIYWRHPIADTKEGATVLAYALPDEPPEYMKQRQPPAISHQPSATAKAAAPEAAAGGDGPAPPGRGPPADELAQRVRQFERENALMAVHRAGAGQVLFLAFDRTWRLRYRIGDTYHHRLWGQVLRWAASGKLPAGTEHVRLGTSRLRYAAEEPVRVRAEIVDQDFKPLTSDEVAVKVFGGKDREDLLLRRKLQYVKGSAGVYEADLGVLPGGAYRVVLDAPVAEPVLAHDQVDLVSAEFSVDPTATVELAELAPDRGLLGRLATLTRGVMVEPPNAREVLAGLGPGSVRVSERREFVLWDSWPLLVLMVLVATAEWVLRKKVGLA